MTPASRLSRLDVLLLGLEDASKLSRPWAALRSVQQSACAATEQRVAQHTDELLEADATVTSRLLTNLRADLRDMTPVADPSHTGPTAARGPCNDQLLEHQALLRAAAWQEQAQAAQLAQRIVEAGQRVSAAHAARNDELRAAAARAAEPAEAAVEARQTMSVVAKEAKTLHGERHKAVEQGFARMQKRMTTEEAALGPACERLRRTAVSARQLCRRREEGHAAVLNKLRLPIEEAVSGMQQATDRSALRRQREQLEQETRVLRRECRAEHLRWLRLAAAQSASTAELIDAHLDEAERARAQRQPVPDDYARTEARVDALLAGIEQLRLDVPALATTAQASS